MSTNLRLYPHLPLLTFEQCFSIFRLAGVTFNMLATNKDRMGLLPFSRQSVYFWRKGRKPHPLARDTVSTLAYFCLAALRDKTLPKGKRPAIATVVATLAEVDLNKRTAEELLPAAWRQAITQEQ